MKVSNINLASVLSDFFDKIVQTIMNKVLSNEIINYYKISKHIHSNYINSDKII